MSDIAIRVENLGKKYKIGANQARYQTLRESIVNGFSYSIERIKGNSPKENNIIWALKDINFEVKHGEVLGIIGRNGAGKSTLLKILSRITRPTTGRFELNGRVGSLLEVGTGFHPELTGRENIYLSGAILGMKRKEINRKFDEIVDFAEIEKFLDTSVKHYSSGMYMRLAFSVAAHLEPEILLVDEVLAVGDVAFQNKCLNKMDNIANQGRTILFVSHNLTAIGKLCPKSILLNNGKIDQINQSKLSINKYLESLSNATNNFIERIGTQRAKITHITILNKDDIASSILSMGDTVKIIISGETTSKQLEFTVAIQLVSMDGSIILYGADLFTPIKPQSDLTFSFSVKIQELLVMPGEYYFNFWIGKSGIEEFDYIKYATKITVFQGDQLPVSYSVDQSLGLIFSNILVQEVENH
jgi:lipopolysaccharide transport system ATP-binding protein